MPTMGWLSRTPPVLPKNEASPKQKTPPSVAASQYPPPLGVGAKPTIGRFSRMPPSEPWNAASPKQKTPPPASTAHMPRPDGVPAAARTSSPGRTLLRTSPMYGVEPNDAAAP